MGASVTLYSRRRAHEKRGERGKSNVYRLGSARRGQATPEVISCRLFTSQPSILLCKYYYWPSRAPFQWKIDARTLVLRDEKGEKTSSDGKNRPFFVSLRPCTRFDKSSSSRSHQLISLVPACRNAQSSPLLSPRFYCSRNCAVSTKACNTLHTRYNYFSSI